SIHRRSPRRVTHHHRQLAPRCSARDGGPRGRGGADRHAGYGGGQGDPAGEHARQDDRSGPRRPGQAAADPLEPRVQRDQVHAESAGPGQGATFTVTLPITDERPAGPAEAGMAARALASGRLAALNGVRVLVVDDDEDARELMRAILAQCGAEVTVTATARAA